MNTERTTLPFVLLMLAAMFSAGCGTLITRTAPQATQSMAPEFSLTDASGTTVRLSDLRAKGVVMVVFYRGAWCPFCRVQLSELEGYRARLAKSSVSIVAISADEAPASQKLAANRGLGFPLLSDPDLTAISQWGVAMEGRDIAVPAVFLVAPGGTIIERHIGEAMNDRPKTLRLVLNAEAWVDDRLHP